MADGCATASTLSRREYNEEEEENKEASPMIVKLSLVCLGKDVVLFFLRFFLLLNIRYLGAPLGRPPHFFRFSASQSNPSKRPSPFIAEVLKMVHVLLFIL